MDKNLKEELTKLITEAVGENAEKQLNKEDLFEMIDKAMKACPPEKEPESTAESVKSVSEVFAETRKMYDEIVRKLEPTEKGGFEPNVKVGKDHAEDKPWESTGHFMKAVARAYGWSGDGSGGVVDPRLYAPYSKSTKATGSNEAIGSEGGFLVNTTQQAEFLQPMYDTGVFTSRARRFSLDRGSNRTVINGVDETSRVAGSRWGGLRGYWLAEAQQKTGSYPKFKQIELNLKKIAVLWYATDEVLADAVQLQSIAVPAMQTEIDFMVNDSFYNGLGGYQPEGVITAGAKIQVSRSGAASTVLSEDILNMYMRRHARNTSNYVWCTNQDIEAQLYTMELSVGTGGQLTFMPAGGLSESPYARLMGLPVLPNEFSATLGTEGDIALVDWTQYGYIDQAASGASSIHLKFDYDETVFRAVYRVDGRCLWNSALTPFKGSSTQSPIITLV